MIILNHHHYPNYHHHYILDRQKVHMKVIVIREGGVLLLGTKYGWTFCQKQENVYFSKRKNLVLLSPKFSHFPAKES